MSSINDFATTYMCQSLPCGGVKQSGFDRFAGGRAGGQDLAALRSGSGWGGGPTAARELSVRVHGC